MLTMTPLSISKLLDLTPPAWVVDWVDPAALWVAEAEAEAEADTVAEAVAVPVATLEVENKLLRIVLLWLDATTEEVELCTVKLEGVLEGTGVELEEGGGGVEEVVGGGV
jgi:hypothetical protein